MESRTHAENADYEKQAEIRRQIAALQAQLKEVPPATPPKRRQTENIKVIAAGTPSPKKRKSDARPLSERPKHLTNKGIPPHGKSKPMQLKAIDPPERPLPTPSNLLTNLASIHARSKTVAEPVARSAAFSDKPPESRALSCQERDERLALVEKLAPGPYDHTAPIDDPHFGRLEPNSGIHLTLRTLAHAELQEHLRGRYYVSPSLLYSVIRPLPSNQGYDVPIPGDWLTIAVIAERGPIKLTATNSTAHPDDEGLPTNAENKAGKGKQKAPVENKKTQGKKYMSIKLVDFGTRSRTLSSTPKAQIRGDALLTLLLFEADSSSCIEDENRPKASKVERTKIYKGGSGGAFEACMKLHEGAVIAILNPKILKPYQRNATAPHPTSNILAITPTSAQSIAIIGRSRDLGMCGAVKRDGKTCGNWCDKRISECCEYHVEHAVQRKRAGRAEFSIGTSGMTTTAKSRKPAFDPDRKWGLLPSADGALSKSADTGSTYVMPGHVISASGPEYVSEKIGRGREERAKRRREEKEADEVLNRLLGRDGGGGNRNAAAGAVRKAREVMKTLKGDKKGKASTGDKVLGTRKSGYSAETIKMLGFDPAAKAGQEGHAGDVALKRKLDALASLQENRGEIALGPRPGKRIRSGVSVPDGAATASGGSDSREDDEGSEDEVETEEATMLGKTLQKPAFEDSDDDLEIEPPP